MASKREEFLPGLSNDYVYLVTGLTSMARDEMWEGYISVPKNYKNKILLLISDWQARNFEKNAQRLS